MHLASQQLLVAASEGWWVSGCYTDGDYEGDLQRRCFLKEKKSAKRNYYGAQDWRCEQYESGRYWELPARRVPKLTDRTGQLVLLLRFTQLCRRKGDVFIIIEFYYNQVFDVAFMCRKYFYYMILAGKYQVVIKY